MSLNLIIVQFRNEVYFGHHPFKINFILVTSIFLRIKLMKLINYIKKLVIKLTQIIFEDQIMLFVLI